ncbi:MAG: hypothetical protein QF704_13630, partial [Anaerolineales bacterium]|nr:hypothetical protein [Anaerolineales bacterium]
SGLTIAANSGCAHYNPTSDRVVVSGGGLSDSVILVPASGNHIVAGNMPAAVFLANGTANFIPDPSSATSLIIEVDGTVHPLDTTNGTWGSTTSVPSPLSQVNGLADTQYIPISDLGVILIVVYAGSNSSRMFMWRYS